MTSMFCKGPPNHTGPTLGGDELIKIIKVLWNDGNLKASSLLMVIQISTGNLELLQLPEKKMSVQVGTVDRKV